MILVTVGTQDKEFRRLFIEVERLIENGRIKEKVVAQVGNTKFVSKYDKDIMEVIDFTLPSQMQDLIKEASFIISHGGVATIVEAVNQGKKILAIPRLKEYKEHVNNHQLQIIENFDKNGYIIGLHGVDELESALKRIDNFYPKKYVSNNERFVNKLEETIKNFM